MQQPINGWAVYKEVAMSTYASKDIVAVRLTEAGAEAARRDIMNDIERKLEEHRAYWREHGKSEKWLAHRYKAPSNITYTIEPYLINP